MDLITRCPQCSHTFSVSLEQLQLRKGYIRCINCANIFDGYEAVVASTGAQGKAPAEPVVPALPVPPVRPEPEQQEPIAVVPPRHEPAPSAPAWREPAVPPPSRRDEPAPSWRESPPPAPPRRDEPAPSWRESSPPVVVRQRTRGDTGPTFTVSAEPPSLPEADEEPDFRVGGPIRTRPEPGFQIGSAPEPGAPLVYMEPKAAAKSAHAPAEPVEYRRTGGFMRMFWLVLVLGALALLIGQLVWVWRAQIANEVPALRPVLERACVPLECDVPYARKIGAINIMSSSLRAGAVPPKSEAGDKAGQDAQADMMLAFTMRNTLGQPQEWPTVVLTLTDAAGVAVVRKNLPPDTYLPEASQKEPFGAGAEVTVRLPLMLNGRQVNGYKLDKYFQ